MNYKLTRTQLEYWLRQKEYTVPNTKLSYSEMKNPDVKKMERHNRILGRSFHHTFEIWFKKWKRIPTPQEFTAMQMQDLKKNFNCDAWKRNQRVDFELSPIVEKAIKCRILRSYISFINEIHTELTIKELFPNCEVIRNDELDFAGIDLLVKDKKHKVEHKIHITKDSEYAIDFLFRKEGKLLEFRGYESKLYARPCWKRTKHAIYKDRSFKGHTFFLYNTKANPNVKLVNGYPLFTDSFIKNKLEVNVMLRAV